MPGDWKRAPAARAQLSASAALLGPTAAAAKHGASTHTFSGKDHGGVRPAWESRQEERRREHTAELTAGRERKDAVRGADSRGSSCSLG